LTIGEYLESHGYEILVAHAGLEAIESAQINNPDVILMDIQMPVMDGIEAIKRIRLEKSAQEVPIIAVTALAMAGDRERCLKAGANEYMTKPFRLDGLTEVILGLTGGK